jgi:hypothetical protein
MFSELSSELLPIYLNDHLALATAGRDLARRSAGANEGSELGDFLAGLAADIDADRELLVDVMARLAISRDPIKLGAAWLGEKVGRLKLNGRLLEYSPLSRVIELEALIAGVNGKLALWRTLAAAAPTEPRIADIDFTQLVGRAEEQLEALEARHTAAVATMLSAA